MEDEVKIVKPPLSQKILGSIKRHKVVSVVFVIVVLLIATWIAWNIINIIPNIGSGGSSFVSGIAGEDVGAPSFLSLESFQGTRRSGSVAKDYPETGTTGVEIEVKEGSVRIKSKDANAEATTIESMTSRYSGYVEQRRRSESNVMLRITLTARLPSEKFDDFFKELSPQFDVKSYDINNYRIQAQREIDEIEILQQALRDYENVRKEIQAMTVSKSKIDLLMDVTNRELELKQKEKQFRRGLTTKEQRGDLATMTIALEERRSAELWPEDVGNRLKDSIKQALEKITDTLIAMATESIVLFFSVIKWILYGLIVVIPLLFVYLIGRKIIIWMRHSRPDVKL